MLDKFVEISTFIGSQIPQWTQGKGGNISLKEHSQDILYIKASGMRLSDMSATTGIAEVGLREFLTQFSLVKTEEEYEACVKNSAKTESRPSMETGFHAALPKAWVMHFHALSALLMYEAFEKGSYSNAEIHFVPLLMPGLELSNYLKAHPQYAIYVLQNHGVVLHTDNADEVLKKWSDIEKSFLKNQRLEFNEGDLKSEMNEKIYFPDSAVFKRQLTKQFPKFSIHDINADPNLTEIIRATKILFAVKPDLKEIPLEMQNKIQKLPTEKHRA